MAENCFHPSIEGAQHGAKSLAQFLDYAKKSGAAGAQPSNFMLQSDKGFKSAKEIKDTFAKAKLSLDGISAHCPFWVHTTAWTGSPTIRPFIPGDVAKKSAAEIEKWAEDYILRLLDLCAELGRQDRADVLGRGVRLGSSPRVIRGASGRAAITTSSRKDRTASSRRRPRSASTPNRSASSSPTKSIPARRRCAPTTSTCWSRFATGTNASPVNADPSHCWEGEDWETRFLKVAPRIYACHVKNFVIRPGQPLRKMEAGWQKRAMQFVDIPSGDLNMTRYVELLIHTGYPQRYCQVMGTKTAPLIVEAESAYRDLDATSANGIQYVRDHLCFPMAAGSFEDGMGA